MASESESETFLFGSYRIATVTSGRSEYGHTFGGPPDRTGASRSHCGGILIHLLHRLDLTDPAIPFTIPGIRWLPFYYCFDYRANDVGYRLLSDETMVVYFPNDDRNVSDDEDWPDENYPLEFPKSSLAISPFDYDPTNLEDGYMWAGIFGIQKLSRQDQAAAKERAAELAELVPETEEEFAEALSSPFVQGKPNSPCLNPECVNRNIRGSLMTIALMPAEPVPGVHTFGRWGYRTTLIFRICTECYTIRVSNECD